MRFVVVGPGALGCLMAAKLAGGMTGVGDTLWILDHNRERAELLRRQGILYEKLESRKNFSVNADADPSATGGADVVLLCVKSYDLQAALEFCRPLLVPGTLVVFMQNGISHLVLEKQVGGATPVYGCTSEGATHLGAGHIRHAGEGATFLGFLQHPGKAAENLLSETVSRLRNGGLSASVSGEILTRLWFKLFVNVGINALTAIHDCPNGDLLVIPGVEAEMKAAVDEAVRLAAAKGIVPETDPYLATVGVCRATAANVSSMRQDVLKKKRTEIDAINGAVVKEAAELNIPAPVNGSLVLRIKDIEKRYAENEMEEHNDKVRNASGGTQV